VAVAAAAEAAGAAEAAEAALALAAEAALALALAAEAVAAEAAEVAELAGELAWEQLAWDLAWDLAAQLAGEAAARRGELAAGARADRLPCVDKRRSLRPGRQKRPGQSISCLQRCPRVAESDVMGCAYGAPRIGRFCPDSDADRQ
jgi:hypothetical protein